MPAGDSAEQNRTSQAIGQNRTEQERTVAMEVDEANGCSSVTPSSVTPTTTTPTTTTTTTC